MKGTIRDTSVRISVILRCHQADTATYLCPKLQGLQALSTLLVRSEFRCEMALGAEESLLNA